MRQGIRSRSGMHPLPLSSLPLGVPPGLWPSSSFGSVRGEDQCAAGAQGLLLLVRSGRTSASLPKAMSLSVPTPLTVLACALAGPFLLIATGLSTSSLQDEQEIVRPVLAALAVGLVLVATQLIVIAVESLSPARAVRRSRLPESCSARSPRSACWCPSTCSLPLRPAIQPSTTPGVKVSLRPSASGLDSVALLCSTHGSAGLPPVLAASRCYSPASR